MSRHYWHKALAIAGKDLRAELRSRELLSVMGLFALLSLLVFSFALELDRAAREEALSAVLWVTILFTCMLGLQRSLKPELEQGTMDALLLAPGARSALYTGKLLSNALLTGLLCLCLLPLMTLLYGMNMLDLRLLGTALLGTVAFCGIGTLLAALTAQTRASEALLPIAMLPVSLPILLTAVRASKGILNGSNDWQAWLQFLLAITLLYLTLCILLFPSIVEE